MKRTQHFIPSAICVAMLLCCGQAALAQPPCPAGFPLGAAVVVGGAGSGTLTIRPGGGGGFGETFLGNGVPITVCITCGGAPLVGLPASLITVSAPGVVFCPVPDANSADTPTDPLGCASFTGTICGGGCAPFLDVFVAGTWVGAVPVGINSTDTGVASPGFVDAGDLARLASVLGAPAAYTLCMDFNEDGVIDAGDLAYFAGALGAARCGAFCP
jgi:hypothetical protein